MFGIRAITHHYAAIQSLPGRSSEMDSDEVPFVPVACKQDRMRYRSCESPPSTRWTTIDLNPLAKCLQEQDISIRYLQVVGDILGSSSRIVSILRHSFPPLF